MIEGDETTADWQPFVGFVHPSSVAFGPVVEAMVVILFVAFGHEDLTRVGEQQTQCVLSLDSSKKH